MTSLEDLFGLGGRRALVTGSSRGIGRALALGLAEAGADVAVHYAGNEAAAESVAYDIRRCARKAAVFGCDLSDMQAVKDLIPRIEKDFGALDIVIANASVQFRTSWDQVPRSEFAGQVAANLESTLMLMQAVIPGMRERRWGRFVTVGSVQQRKPHPQMAVYAATKSAQESLMRSVARDVAADGVTVNNLAPGVILTDRTRGVLDDDSYREKVTASVPVGFLGVPEDCVGAALLLCSDAGRYMTGCDIYVDGGGCLV